jgi:hypothetical protein
VVAGATPAKFRPARGHGRPGAGGERPSGPLGPILGAGWVWEVAGEGAHRRPAAVAAAGRAGRDRGSTGGRWGAVAALGCQGEARELLGRGRLGERSSPGSIQEGCWCAASRGMAGTAL